MSDTVKLIIEIPESILDTIQADEMISREQLSVLQMHILNGIPLDDTISKIEKLNPVDYGSMFSCESHNGAKEMQRDVLQILDNIGKAESEMQNADDRI